MAGWRGSVGDLVSQQGRRRCIYAARRCLTAGREAKGVSRCRGRMLRLACTKACRDAAPRQSRRRSDLSAVEEAVGAEGLGFKRASRLELDGGVALMRSPIMEAENTSLNRPSTTAFAMAETGSSRGIDSSHRPETRHFSISKFEELMVEDKVRGSG